MCLNSTSKSLMFLCKTGDVQWNYLRIAVVGVVSFFGIQSCAY